MEIASPFVLAAESGELSLDGFETRFGPQLSVNQFEKSDLYARGVKAGSEFSHFDPVFQIKPITLQDGRWAYLNAAFRDGILVRLGFGWGKVRKYGFHELTAAEFQEQLHSYSAWVAAALGPSLPCTAGEVYLQQLSWGRIEVSMDWRTQLPGIGIRFAAMPSRDSLEVSRAANELGQRHGSHAEEHAVKLATEALADRHPEQAAFWKSVADALKLRDK